MQANGVEEFFIHPRQGLGGVFGQTENAYYLSRDYFDKVGFVLGKARELGMHAWLYDDLNWPSGYAGGRVLEGGDVDGREVAGDPELIARYLQVRPREVTGGTTYEEDVPDGGADGWSIEDGALLTDGGDVGLTKAGADWTDYRMDVTATVEDVAAGWVLRARDPGNLIMINLTSTSENNPEAASTFGVHVRENGGYRLLERIPAGVTIEEGEPYRISTEIEGSTLRLSLDGRQVATLTDPAFGALASGRVGFRSDGGGGERARFDDLRVTALGDGRELFADDYSGDLSRYDATIADRPELMAAVAVPVGSGDCATAAGRPGDARLDGARAVELTDRVQDGRLRWDAPAGDWCLLWLQQQRLTAYHPDLEPENNYVDMLNPEATRKFIEITHESYAKRFGADFGGLIRGIFNDEPGFYNNFPDGRGGADTRGSVPWTPGFRAFLESEAGAKAIERLPALWYDTGAGTAAARVDYYDALQDRYTQAHTKPLADWAAAHRISLISNPLVEESLGDHKLIEGGDWFEMSAEYQIPGMDLISGLNLDAVTPKLNSSVAHAFDRGRNLAESFGAFGWDLTLEEMKRGIAWEALGRRRPDRQPRLLLLDRGPAGVREPAVGVLPERLLAALPPLRGPGRAPERPGPRLDPGQRGRRAVPVDDDPRGGHAGGQPRLRGQRPGARPRQRVLDRHLLGAAARPARLRLRQRAPARRRPRPRRGHPRPRRHAARARERLAHAGVAAHDDAAARGAGGDRALRARRRRARRRRGAAHEGGRGPRRRAARAAASAVRHRPGRARGVEPPLRRRPRRVPALARRRRRRRPRGGGARRAPLPRHRRRARPPRPARERARLPADQHGRPARADRGEPRHRRRARAVVPGERPDGPRPGLPRRRLAHGRAAGARALRVGLGRLPRPPCRRGARHRLQRDDRVRARGRRRRRRARGRSGARASATSPPRRAAAATARSSPSTTRSSRSRSAATGSSASSATARPR